MSENVELTSFNLRYECHRMRDDAREARLLASIVQRGIEEPLKGVDTPQERFLLKGFSASFLGPIGAVILTSVLWAALHLQYGLYEIVTTFLFGCMLGAARIKTGSLLLTIGIHAFLNMVATVETIIVLASGST